jgi:hypothetical protein
VPFDLGIAQTSRAWAVKAAVAMPRFPHLIGREVIALVIIDATL